MDLKSRKRLSLLILLLGLPGYIVIAWMLLAWIDDGWGRMPVWAEFLVIVGLWHLWSGAVADPSDKDEDTVALRELAAFAKKDGRVDVALTAVGDGVLICRKK